MHGITDYADSTISINLSGSVMRYTPVEILVFNRWQSFLLQPKNFVKSGKLSADLKNNFFLSSFVDE